MAYRGNKKHIDYMNDWRSKHKKAISFYIDKEYDSDIIAMLDSVDNKTDYIRQLIRADIERSH